MESRTQNTFEQATGVTLPPDYRAFLDEYTGGAALGDDDLVYTLATAQTLLASYPFDHPRIDRPLHRAHVIYLARLRDAGVLVYEGAGAEHPTPPERFDRMVTIGFGESPDAWETGGAPSHVVVLDPETGAVLLVPIDPPAVVHRLDDSFAAWLRKVSRKPAAKAVSAATRKPARKPAAVEKKAAEKKPASGKPAARPVAPKKAAVKKTAAKKAPAPEAVPQEEAAALAAAVVPPQGEAVPEAAPAKPASKKSTTRKATTRKPAARKTTTAKKATAAKAPAKKGAAAKKTVAKKPAAKKRAGKATAAKGPAAKKASPRKRAAKAAARETPAATPPTDVTPAPDRKAA